MNKTFTNICMFIVIGLAFANFFGLSFDTTQQPSQPNQEINIIEKSNTETIDNIAITDDSYTAVNLKKNDNLAPKYQINRSCNSRTSTKGVKEPNAAFEYKTQSTIECNCSINTNDGKVHEYSKTFVREFDRVPTPQENDCDNVCKEVCEDFARKIK
ncbi:MAG: hypothetical protein K5912_03005 [Alphaproteobacteria bacterium]|nr:hypothetical protein [Alphaproteobacteria bacterium]